MDVFEGLVACASDVCRERTQKGLGFGDQDIINAYYTDWEKQPELHLSEAYNCMPMCIDFLRKQNGADFVKVVHFCERIKPWQHTWKSLLLYSAKCVKHREWNRLRALYTYRKFVKKSCPNYKELR